MTVTALLLIALKSFALMAILLVLIAYYLYADRKIWAAVQLRRGPNVVGPWGLLQSFADMLKFVLKEPIIPMRPTRACSSSRRWSWPCSGSRPGPSSPSPMDGRSPTSMSAFSIFSRSRR